MIRQMNKPILEIFRVVLMSAQSDVKITKQPSCERVPIRYEDPLSDIELSETEELLYACGGGSGSLYTSTPPISSL